MSGARCKIIIDQGYAVTRSIGCMQASVLLGAVKDLYPPLDLAGKFKAQAEALALTCQDIAQYYTDQGAT